MAEGAKAKKLEMATAEIQKEAEGKEAEAKAGYEHAHDIIEKVLKQTWCPDDV